MSGLDNLSSCIKILTMGIAQANLMTAEELIRLPKGQHRYELLNGELLTMSPSGGKHGLTVARLTTRLDTYAELNDVGFVFGAETGFRLERDPDTVLAPDISFILKERLADVSSGYMTIAPDLVVEVISPSDRPGRIEAKTRRWLSFGVQSIWLVRPQTRSIETISRTNDKRMFYEADILSDNVVTGFGVLVGEVFFRRQTSF
jgi:Uma2 family endonuclease